MPSPFPGMNPYLEHPDLWSTVHPMLIVAIADVLVPQVRPKYRVAIKKRIYWISVQDIFLMGIPEPSAAFNITASASPSQPRKVIVPVPIEFREGYIEIEDLASNKVVTAIEILCPQNKCLGKGREMYEEKRDRILESRTHLIEIDLLRAGEPMPVLGNDLQANYRILVSRSNIRPAADLYLFNLNNTIPIFSLPLRGEDAEPVVDLQTLLNTVYDRAGYDYTLDYSREPVPALSESETVWADALLREKGLRE